MHLSSPMSLLLIITITILSIQIPPSISQDDAEKYQNCSKTFTCGDLKVDLGYPFSGSTRASYCGHPGFNLNCNRDAPIITINSIDYTIIDVDNTTQRITIASSNYYNTICPDSLIDTTIDFSLFNYASTAVNLTLLYNCPTSAIPADFICQTGTYSYVEKQGLSVTESYCRTVFVTVSSSEYSSVLANPSSGTVVDAFDAGFELQWKLDNGVCNECIESGGGCGWNTSADAFACYCEEGAFSSTCGSGPTGKKSSKKTALIAAVSGGAAGIVLLLLGCWIFVIKKKKKINAVKSIGKDSSTPPSSIVASTSITDFPKSIPSYLYSKSDLEKSSTYFGTRIFSYEELMEATDNFHPSKQLGDGGFGTVYYGELKDGRVVAVKRLYENNFKRVEQFMNEVEILTRLRHKNLVKLYGCTSKRSRELLLVYEYISNGTVADHLHRNQTSSDDKSRLLPWSVRLSIAIETADALAYLHRSDTIHRDVKTNNILLEDDFRVKVADFGLSRLFPTQVTHVSTAPQGTPGYVDPEYYQSYKLTDKSDVYSFGVVLVELLSSLQAVDTNRNRQDINLASMMVNKIVNHQLNELVDPRLGFENDEVVRKAATSVAALAFQCLQQEKEMRPSMEEVLKGLREIEKEQAGSLKAEVDICTDDDIGLLKSMPPPFSPDSVVTENLIMLNRTM